MTVGTCVTDEGLKLEKLVVDDTAGECGRDVLEPVTNPDPELDPDEVLLVMAVVTTVLIWELPVGLGAVKVSVIGDTMLDDPVGTAFVVVFVRSGNSRELDAEDEALDTIPPPVIDP